MILSPFFLQMSKVGAAGNGDIDGRGNARGAECFPARFAKTCGTVLKIPVRKALRKVVREFRGNANQLNALAQVFRKNGNVRSHRNAAHMKTFFGKAANHIDNGAFHAAGACDCVEDKVDSRVSHERNSKNRRTNHKGKCDFGKSFRVPAGDGVVSAYADKTDGVDTVAFAGTLGKCLKRRHGFERNRVSQRV